MLKQAGHPRTLVVRGAATCALLACAFVPIAAQRAAAQSTEGTRYFERGWSFNDVDVGKLIGRLRRIGLNIPIEVVGRISGRLDVGVPWNNLRNARAWRFAGMLTSPELTVNGFNAQEIAVRLVYREGVLGLEQLRIGIPPVAGDRNPASGSVTGAARMELVPRGGFTASSNVSALPLTAVLRAFPALQSLQGRLNGTINAAAAVDRMRELGAWKASGPVTVQGLTFRESPPADAWVQLALDAGNLTGRQFQLRIGPNTLTSEARLGLTGNQPFAVDATLAGNDVVALLKLINGLLQGNQLDAVLQAITSGAMQGTSQIRGTLAPLSTQIAGHAELLNLALRTPAQIAPGLPFKPQTLPRLAFDYSVGNQRLALSNIDATVAGGRVTGTAEAPLGAGNVAANIQWAGVQPTAVLGAPFSGSGASQGRLNLSLPADAMDDFARWQMELNVALSELLYGDLAVTSVQTGNVTLKEGRLTVPQFSALLNGQPATLSLDMLLKEPWTLATGFNLSNLQLAWLRSVPQLAAYANRLTGSVNLSGQFSGAWKPLALTGRGHIAGRGIRLDENMLDSINLDYELTPEKATLTNLQALLYSGQLNGNATVTLGEKLGGTAAFAWNGVEAAAAVRAVGNLPVRASGAISGTLNLTVPAGSLKQREQWTGAATIQLPAMDIYAWQLRNIQPIELQLAEGQLAVPKLSAQLDGQPLEAQLSLGINAPWNVAGQLSLRRVQLQRLTAVPQLSTLQGRLSGLADLTANVQGTLEPFALTAHGQIAAAPIAIDNHLIDRVALSYNYQADALTLSGINATLYGGQATGDVTIPLSEAFGASATVQWNAIDVGRLASEFQGVPKNLSGSTSGDANIKTPAGARDRWPEWDVDAHVALRELTLNRTSLASLDAAVSQHTGNLNYSANGSLLDGALRLEGNRDQSLAAQNPSSLAALGSATLTWREGSIARIAELAADPASLPGPVEGTIDVDATSTAAPEGWSWRGGLRLANVRVDGVDITPGVEARAAGSEDAVRIERLSGQVAGGELGGAGRWRFNQRQPRTFRITLRNARAERLTAFAVSPADAPVTGPVDIAMRISPGQVWRISGDVASNAAEVGGVPFRNVQVPVDFDWYPPTGRMQLVAGDTQLALSGGRVRGRLTAQRAAGWSLDGKYKFFRVDMGTLTRQLGSTSSYGKGRLSGTLTISGRNMQSVNDLRGRLVADLEDTQASSIPVLSQLRNYVPGSAAAASSSVNQGRVEARLSRGAVHLDRLSLVSQQLQLYMTGIINLTGRLNLDATVATGDFGNPVVTRLLNARLLSATIAPVGLLVSANEFLSNRVIHLSIGGTISRPVIRVRPFESLREEAVRFFLQQATGQAVNAVLPAAAAGAAGTPAAGRR